MCHPLVTWVWWCIPSKNKCEEHKAKKGDAAKHCVSPFVLNLDVASVLSVDDFSAQRVSYELLCSEAKPEPNMFRQLRNCNGQFHGCNRPLSACEKTVGVPPSARALQTKRVTVTQVLAHAFGSTPKAGTRTPVSRAWHSLQLLFQALSFWVCL